MPSLTQLKNMVLLLIAAISLGTSLLIVVYCLPTNVIYNHIRGSE